ncbi:hypothetical protein [Pseudomonas mangiferae]|uniref:Uncharacterized protein n=1 Tax=Pseudomonas mangiferae TaxID=2593654 RepID=A0A553H3N8_9PSED|nr:hypothetical protein [Pseudomonas mangiferae]TRX76334.1 hypothetical protein FM069_03865 [Pseudomonas mangiferae]
MELNKAVLDCMQRLRRLLRDEQALDIRLSQPDAVQALLQASHAAEHPEIRQLGERLAELSGERLPAPVPSEEELIRRYTQYAGPLRG